MAVMKHLPSPMISIEFEFPKDWEAPDFTRKLCVICKTKDLTPIYLIEEERICFLCLDKLRFKCHLKLEDIEKLTIKKAQKLLK